jgi:hypothetical protein
MTAIRQRIYTNDALYDLYCIVMLPLLALRALGEHSIDAFRAAACALAFVMVMAILLPVSLAHMALTFSMRAVVGPALRAGETLLLRALHRFILDPGVLIEVALALATIGFGIWVAFHRFAPFRVLLVSRAPWWVWLIIAMVLGVAQFLGAGLLRERIRARICGITFVAWSMFLFWLLILGGLNLLHYTLGPLVISCLPRIVSLFGPYEEISRRHTA